MNEIAAGKKRVVHDQRLNSGTQRILMRTKLPEVAK